MSKGESKEYRTRLKEIHPYFINMESPGELRLRNSG